MADFRLLTRREVTAARRAPAWLAAALLVCPPWLFAQPGRVSTGIDLRMTDTLGSVPSPAASTRATPQASAAGPGGGGGPPGPRLAGLSLVLTTGIRMDDNALRSNSGERRDAIVVVQPKLYLDGRVGRHGLRLGYEADMERFQRIGSENHLDHVFLANLDLDLERRLKARVESALEFGTDTRGDLESRPVFAGEPDRWREHRVAGQVTLGRRIARAQVGARYGVRGRRYLNNAQEDRDLDERQLTLTGRYNLGPRYSVLSELSGTWTDYLDPTSTLDSRRYEVLLGVAWEATAKTRGEVKVGLRHLDFHDPGRPSLDGFTWDARVTWAPRTYSQLTLYTARDVVEGGFSAVGGPSSAATSDTVGLRWRHGLSERLQFEAGAERTLSAFSGSQEDEFIALDAGVRYRMNRWVDMFARWSYDSRSAAVPAGDFEAGSVFVGFEARLDRRLGR